MGICETKNNFNNNVENKANTQTNIVNKIKKMKYVK